MKNICGDEKHPENGDMELESSVERFPEGKKKKRTLLPVEYAVFLLSRRSYSVEELRRKMRMKLYGEKETEEVISLFLQQGFLNDVLFAESLASSLHNAGYGRKRIAAKLREKGIASGIIRETLQGEEKEMAPSCREFSFSHDEAVEEEEVSPDREKEGAAKALKGKMRSLLKEPDLRKRREKALRFLAGRGFDAGTCYQVVDQYLKEGKDSSFY